MNREYILKDFIIPKYIEQFDQTNPLLLSLNSFLVILSIIRGLPPSSELPRQGTNQQPRQ